MWDMPCFLCRKKDFYRIKGAGTENFSVLSFVLYAVEF